MATPRSSSLNFLENYFSKMDVKRVSSARRSCHHKLMHDADSSFEPLQLPQPSKRHWRRLQPRSSASRSLLEGHHHSSRDSRTRVQINPTRTASHQRLVLASVHPKSWTTSLMLEVPCFIPTQIGLISAMPTPWTWRNTLPWLFRNLVVFSHCDAPAYRAK